MKQKNIRFSDFLEFFPEVELPVTLTEESAVNFSAINKAISLEAIDQFIIPHEAEHDELTEYVPCFRLPDTGNIHAIVYWKAGVLNYEYKLITYDKNAELIDGKVIAATITNGESIVRTVATIDPDWIIHSVVGEQKLDSRTPNTASKAFNLEMLATGEIIFSLNEDKL